MNRLSRFLITLTLTIGFTAGASGLEKVELKLDNAMAPVRGFDNNDNVQVVVKGNLPNACYELAEATFERNDAGRVITIHQFANHKVDGICANSENLPAYLQMVIPFTNEVSVGVLNAGDYKFEFKKYTNENVFRPFFVSVASSPSIDSLPYAATTSAIIKDVVTTQENVMVRLSGVLNSSCTELDDVVRVEKLDDVFVILPTIKVDSSVMCLQMLRPFEKIISLGKISKEGQYLMHIRTMRGGAVNHIFEVTQ